MKLRKDFFCLELKFKLGSLIKISFINFLKEYLCMYALNFRKILY